MDKETLEYLIDCKIFSITNYAKTFKSAIWFKEILMSRKIIEKKWNIGSLLKCYKDVDFTFETTNLKECKIIFYDDLMLPKFRNLLWKEEELVFIKGNRVKLFRI